MLAEIDGEPGYVVGQMPSDDFAVLQSLIFDSYLSRILSLYPELSCQFYTAGMKNYHLITDKVNHRVLWPKRARILGPAAVESIKLLKFFKRLTKELNIQGITGEDGSGWQEMYWRVVRPGNDDIGDFHADKWFWDLGHGEIAPGMRRLKIWIAIETQPGRSGLRVIPSSHLRSDWKYHGETDGSSVTKPKFDEDINTLDIMNLSTKPGDFIVFHDELLHCGMPNQSDSTRFSIEATLLVPSEHK
jgi:hypothetical protein